MVNPDAYGIDQGMQELVQLGIPKKGVDARRPEWLRVKVRDTDVYKNVKDLLKGLKLNTVCEEARCPNIWECWGEHRTATFMIMGDVCTRNCRYCSVTSGKPEPLDEDEPHHVAEAVVKLGLSHAVITSVDRDDLADFGSGHFVETIIAVRKARPQCKIEVLIPDFGGSVLALKNVLLVVPDVLNHNTETVPRLYKRVRSKGDYKRCLGVLNHADVYRRQHNVKMTTKTGMMVGLGETADEIYSVMDDLRGVNCDVLTIGQYLNPTQKHIAIDRFYTPEEFLDLKKAALKRGFKHVESGPLVRSSYHAHEHVPQVTK